MLPPIDLTSKIIVTGVESVVTTSPTSPSQPFVIAYDVRDNAVPPNKAQTMKRRVQVWIWCDDSDPNLKAFGMGLREGKLSSELLHGYTGSSYKCHYHLKIV